MKWQARITFLLIFGASQIARLARASDAQNVLQSGRQKLVNEKTGANFWNFPSYMGAHYVSAYFVALHAFPHRATLFDATRFKKLLLNSQRSDGSWDSVPDPARLAGDLNATTLNYWALKLLGEDPAGSVMRRARDFVLSHGGLEKTNALTRIYLSVFGVLNWDDFPLVPPEKALSKPFAQWILPHLLPIGYLRTRQVTYRLANRFLLDELKKNPRPALKIEIIPDACLLKNVVDAMRTEQRPHGSFGGYITATPLTLLALEDYRLHCPLARRKITATIDRGFAAVETRFFKSAQSSYLGVHADGRNWDTALALRAIADNNEDTSAIRALKPAAEFLARQQSPNGGYGFGEDFQPNPDTDTTAEILLALRHFYRADDPPVRDGLKWLRQMQNSDGGWGAFTKNNNGNFLLSLFASPFKDSAELFDPASADVTGHVLEALAAFGEKIDNSETVRRGVHFLRHAQKQGRWEGRWGVNYLYGTSAAVVGLVRAGVPASDRAVVNAVEWLEKQQNPSNGGFGESTRSYDEPKWAGRGITTASQTAWVLSALVAGGERNSDAATKAANYLAQNYRHSPGGYDASATGTGHRRIAFIVYPSYAKTFPLIALGNYFADPN